MNETEIKQMLLRLTNYCEDQYVKSKCELEQMDHDHPNWQIENYMTGYHKGRHVLLEYINNAINPKP